MIFIFVYVLLGGRDANGDGGRIGKKSPILINSYKFKTLTIFRIREDEKVSATRDPL